jgi:hypothetical protein
LATNQPADRSPEQQTQPGARTDLSDVKPALPRRVTSYGMYESSSSDPYTMPASDHVRQPLSPLQTPMQVQRITSYPAGRSQIVTAHPSGFTEATAQSHVEDLRTLWTRQDWPWDWKPATATTASTNLCRKTAGCSHIWLRDYFQRSRKGGWAGYASEIVASAATTGQSPGKGCTGRWYDQST